MTDKVTAAFLLGNLTVGGSETKFIRLANRLSAAGHDIHIVALGAPYTLRRMIDRRVHLECLDRKARFSLSTVARLRTYLADHRIGVTICVNTYPLIYGWPSRLLLGGENSTCFGAINTSEHTTYRDKLFMLLYGPILRHCDGVIFGSQEQARDWIRQYRIRTSRSRVIYNGVDTSYFKRDESLRWSTRESLNIPESAFVVGCVAQFRPEKKHANLIEAIDRLHIDGRHPLFALLVGAGPEEETTRQLVKQKGLQDRVKFVGQVNDVRPFLNAMDVFVLPSTSVEVFSNAVLEAMAVGVPVISSDTGGAKEMIRDGIDGFVYPRHDIGMLTAKLRTLLDDARLRETFRQSSFERIQNEFTLDQMDCAYIEVIQSRSIT